MIKAEIRKLCYEPEETYEIEASISSHSLGKWKLKPVEIIKPNLLGYQTLILTLQFKTDPCLRNLRECAHVIEV